jgi:hypothetical protein
MVGVLSETTAGMVYNSSAWASNVERVGSFLMIALASMTSEWTCFSGVVVCAAGDDVCALSTVSDMVGAGFCASSCGCAAASVVGSSIVGLIAVCRRETVCSAVFRVLDAQVSE